MMPMLEPMVEGTQSPIGGPDEFHFIRGVSDLAADKDKELVPKELKPVTIVGEKGQAGGGVKAIAALEQFTEAAPDKGSFFEDVPGPQCLGGLESISS